MSKAEAPRCSRCGTREVEEVKATTTTPTTISTIPSPPSPILDYAKIFTAFDEGKDMVEVVKEGLCNPNDAIEMWNMYKKLKSNTLDIRNAEDFRGQILMVDERIRNIEKALKNSVERIEILVRSNDEKINTLSQKYKFLHSNLFHHQQYLLALADNLCPNCGRYSVYSIAECYNCKARLVKTIRQITPSILPPKK